MATLSSTVLTNAACFVTYAGRLFKRLSNSPAGPTAPFERALPLPLRTLLTLVELELVTGWVMVRPEKALPYYYKGYLRPSPRILALCSRIWICH